jgi:acetyltransferase-like isoleucine patch superfamily enzyme
VILADVGRGSIVAAGAVVTHPIPDRVVAAGVPARVVKFRDEPEATKTSDDVGKGSNRTSRRTYP